jgi:hypothetical protein
VTGGQERRVDGDGQRCSSEHHDAGAQADAPLIQADPAKARAYHDPRRGFHHCQSLRPFRIIPQDRDRSGDADRLPDPVAPGVVTGGGGVGRRTARRTGAPALRRTLMTDVGHDCCPLVVQADAMLSAREWTGTPRSSENFGRVIRLGMSGDREFGSVTNRAQLRGSGSLPCRARSARAGPIVLRHHGGLLGFPL